MSTVTAPARPAAPPARRPGRPGGDTGPSACQAGCDAVTRLEIRRPALRHTLVRQPAPARRAGLTWPRLPAAAEAAITGAGYLAYALVRLAVRAGRHAAAELWRA